VRRNDPAQIIIEDGIGNACEKRNAGARRATEPWILFVDDDSVLRDGCIETMLGALERDPGAAFAYGDVEMVLYPGIPYPHPAGLRRAQPWNRSTIIWGNYVETTSLLRREAFPGFDPEIKRFQDWDLWLTISAKGPRGVYIPEVLLELHHFDLGITASVPFEEAFAAIKTKHRLP
jgi:GT2 family glycosyltransferase